MNLPVLHYETVFAMTALSHVPLMCFLWLVGRSYPRQGVAWFMAATVALGLGYLCLALSTTALPRNIALTGSFWCISAGTTLITLAMRRFLQGPWTHTDTAILLLPVVISLLCAVLSSDFALYSRSSYVGIALMLLLLAVVAWQSRSQIPGNGWKVMMLCASLQLVSVVPLIFREASPLQAPAQQSLLTQLLPYITCIMLFMNIPLGVLSFLMMLLDRRHAQERAAAEIDVLTQLPNRRSLDRQLAALLPPMYRSREHVAVLLLDIDHFKKVNDQHGHDAGDLVLQHVAAVLQKQLRQKEMIARYGGEEFVVVLPGASREQAQAVAERIVASVAQAPLPTTDHTFHITVSAGVYVQQLSPEDLQQRTPAAHWKQMLNAADAALYAAKRAGRNRYVMADAHSPAAGG